MWWRLTWSHTQNLYDTLTHRVATPGPACLCLRLRDGRRGVKGISPSLDSVFLLCTSVVCFFFPRFHPHPFCPYLGRISFFWPLLPSPSFSLLATCLRRTLRQGVEREHEGAGHAPGPACRSRGGCPRRARDCLHCVSTALFQLFVSRGHCSASDGQNVFSSRACEAISLP